MSQCVFACVLTLRKPTCPACWAESGQTSWTNSLSVSWGWYLMAGWEKYEAGCCRMGEEEKWRLEGGAWGLARERETEYYCENDEREEMEV